MPIWKVIEEVLLRHGQGRAMRVADVCRIATEGGLLQLESRTPENSVRAILSMEKHRNPPRLFSRAGWVALTEDALNAATMDGEAGSVAAATTHAALEPVAETGSGVPPPRCGDVVMPTWRVIQEVLQRHGQGQAMRVGNVYRIAKEGLLRLESKTPENSFRAILSMEKHRKPPRLFSGGGWVALTEDALNAVIGEANTPSVISGAAPPTRRPPEPIEVADVELFRRALLADFPRGIAFSPAAEALLASAAGKGLLPNIRAALQTEMFRCSDGTWLLAEMVADGEAIARIASRATQHLQDSGCFAIGAVRDEFLPLLRHLPDPEVDFHRFFARAVASKLGCELRVSGGKAIRLCHRSGEAEAQVYENVVARIVLVLQCAGDAVSAESLREQLPFLDLVTLDWIIREKLPSAIALTLDGIRYWKLVEHFYLPEDASEQVTRIIAELEEEGYSPSLTLIEGRLNPLYGDGFCENFALSDTAVFQQVISVCYRGQDGRAWRNRVFFREDAEVRRNVLDDFLLTQDGVFHESAFFEYAERARGLTSQSMLILAFLRAKCIRLSRDYWVPLAHFVRNASLTPEDEGHIAVSLMERLGDQAFLPLGLLPTSFFDSLPMFALNGNPCPWNAYLLASFCSLRIPALRIVNDEPSPYTVTAMLIPKDATLTDDVVDYVLDAYRTSGLVARTADEVFECLKQQQVRMAKGEKLMARIRSTFGVE